MTAPTRLRVEDLPLSTEVAATRWIPVATSSRPSLSWVVPLQHRGQGQRGYQLRVTAEGTDPRDTTAQAWWDSGRRKGSGVREPWLGSPLAPHTRSWWSVRSWDENDVVSPWAEPVAVETGWLPGQSWAAEWIEVPATHAARGELDLAERPVLARLHLTARGQVRAELDGIPVNGDCADPSRSAGERALIRAYDVSDLLVGGHHVLDLVAARGHERDTGQVPLLAQLVCTFADGSVRKWGTDAAWRHRTSQVTHEEAFYLERHDPASVGGPWSAVARSAQADVRTEPDPSPPLQVVSWRAAAECGLRADGVRVLDVGTNVAGRACLTVRGVPVGKVIRVVHGEVLDADSRVSTRNIRLPGDRDRERQVLEHVCSGDDPEVLQPWFAVHGFRYVEVQGLPVAAEVQGQIGVLHTDAAVTGRFACDDPLLERLVSVALRTQLNNLHSLPEDCPTREQSGWTGDAAASARAAYAHLDMSGLYRKWLLDLREDQRADGAVPGVTPTVAGTSAPPDPVWGAAYPVVVQQHWLHTGDAALVRDHLGGLGRWCDYQRGLLVDGLVRRAEISYGHDWLAPRQTPPVMLQTCAVLSCLTTVAALEEACGDPAVAARRRDQAVQIRTAARQQLRDPVAGTWANGSQGALGLAATTGLAEPEEVPQLLEMLRRAVHDEGDRLTSGFASTAAVVRALAETDGGSALLACIHQGEQPGVGSMLVEGPGTFWETWWIDRENVGVASLDHIGLAAPFAEWAWTGVAGLRPTGPGWSTFDIAPAALAGVGRVEAEVWTVRGRVCSALTRTGDVVRLGFEVPVGSVATVRLPGAATARVLGDGIDLQVGTHPQLDDLRAHGDDLLLRAVAGRYVVETTGVRPPVSSPTVPVPTGVVRSGRWLGDGTRCGGWASGQDGTHLVWLPQGVVCEPVFHEPLPGPVLLVGGEADHPTVVRSAVLQFDTPRDLDEARGVFAHVDFCVPLPPRYDVRALLRLTSADGSTVEVQDRPLPVGWNRLGADVTGWPGRSALVRFDVEVRCVPAAGNGSPGAADLFPVSFRLGRVGWTTARLTW